MVMIVICHYRSSSITYFAPVTTQYFSRGRTKFFFVILNPCLLCHEDTSVFQWKEKAVGSVVCLDDTLGYSHLLVFIDSTSATQTDWESLLPFFSSSFFFLFFLLGVGVEVGGKELTLVCIVFVLVAGLSFHCLLFFFFFFFFNNDHIMHPHIIPYNEPLKS